MDSNTVVIKKVGLAVIKDRKMLMVHNKKHGTQFSTLGGKYEQGEDDIACLVREVKEEVGTEIDLESLEFLGTFEGAVIGRENTFVNIRLYTGALLGEPKPQSEIDELKYFESNIPQENLTPASEKIFIWLKKHDYID